METFQSQKILRGITNYAKFISLIFYPSFLQALMASFFGKDLWEKIYVWTFFLLLPAILSIFYIRNVNMPVYDKWVVPKEYRIVPMLLAIISTSIFYFLFVKEPGWLKAITLSSILLTTIALPITYFWKISLHMIGMGGMTAFLWLFNDESWWFLLISIIASQQVAWARMFLRSHDIWQILAGYFLGVICFALAYMHVFH